MTARQAIGIVVAITIAFVILVTTQSKAEETLPQPKPLHIKVTGYIQNEWNEIKAFQKQGWEDGKAQLAQNKQQIVNLFNKAKTLITSSNESSN